MGTIEQINIHADLMATRERIVESVPDLDKHILRETVPEAVHVSDLPAEDAETYSKDWKDARDIKEHTLDPLSKSVLTVDTFCPSSHNVQKHWLHLFVLPPKIWTKLARGEITKDKAMSQLKEIETSQTVYEDVASILARHCPLLHTSLASNRESDRHLNAMSRLAAGTYSEYYDGTTMIRSQVKKGGTESYTNLEGQERDM